MTRALLAALVLLGTSACGSCGQQKAGVADAGATLVARPMVLSGPLGAEQRAQAELAITNNCLACHTHEMLDQQRLTPAQWAANVKKMQGWGAPLEPGELELVTSYLSEKYGPSAGTYGIPEVDSKVAAASMAPTPDADWGNGEVAKGETLYKASCLSCHGADGKGERLGVNVVDRPVLYRAADFAQMVIKGRNRMPETTGVQKADIAALLAYLRTLKG